MLQDLRYGARMLLKNPGFTLMAVITLALGIGANTAIFTIVNAVLLRPLPYPEAERLMELGRIFVGSEAVSELSEQKFVFLRAHSQSFEAITATMRMGDVAISDASQTDSIGRLAVTADFFRVLGVAPALGRGFTATEDSPAGERVAVLGDGLWRRWFGADPGIIGKQIALNNVDHTVVGILPPGFDYFGPQDVLIPLRVNPASRNAGHNWKVIGRLKQGVAPGQARQELAMLFDRFRADDPRDTQQKESFGAQNWRVNMTRDVQGLLWLLLGAVGFVLLIACANVANLQLTRAAARQKEMAIRRALGAGGGRLLRQLLTESVLLAVLGGGAGLLLAVWGLDALLAFVPAGLIPRIDEIAPDGHVLAFAFGASLLTGIAFGLAPALQAGRLDVNRALKEGAGKTVAGGARGRLRSVLVVVEIALALTLTVGAGLLLRTFANLRGVAPGFDASQVLTFELAPRGPSYDSVAKLNDLYRRALERFGALPGVEAAALTSKLPLDDKLNLPYRLAGQNEFGGSAEYRLISPGYFRAMKMTLQQGRPFDERDAAGAEPVIIVNEAFVRRHFAGAAPLGQQLCAGCEYGDLVLRRIVGVVNETKQRNLKDAAPAMVFIPAPQAADGVRGQLQWASLVLRATGDPLRLGAAIRDELRQIDPALPLNKLRLLEQLVDRSVAPQRFNLALLGLFAGLGLLLAAVGIYGVMAYSVAARIHEIGIRMALGAKARDVLRLVVAQGMKLAVIGTAIGLLASFALTRLMKTLLFGVSATDPLTFVAIAFLLAVVALLACWIPARRASKVDPMIALRCE